MEKAAVAQTAARYREHMSHKSYDDLRELAKFDAPSDDELETLHALGHNLFTCRKYGAARDLFERLTDLAPDTPYFWRALGTVHQQLGDYPAAIQAYTTAIAGDEGDVESYVYRAESRVLSGQSEDGLADLRKVVEIGVDSQFAAAWVPWATLLLEIHEAA